MTAEMSLRAYRESDASETFDVFARAIRQTASRDYTAQQVEAWSGVNRDLGVWNRARTTANTQVAQIDGRVVGFTDVDEHGYIDMLFVEPRDVRKGVASALLAWAAETARAAGATQLSTHASITARAFFEARGFVVDEQRAPIVRGVSLTNFAMSRQI